MQEPSEQQQHVLAPAAVLPPTFIKAADRIVACEWLHTQATCSCSISWLDCSACCRSPHGLLLPRLHMLLCCWLSWTSSHAAAVDGGSFHLYRCGCPAVGDIHGDLQKAVTALETAGVLTEHNQSVKWTGGNTVVVQLGDVLDRGDSEIGANSASLTAQAARHAVGGVTAGVLSCTQEGTFGSRAGHLQLRLLLLRLPVHAALGEHR